LPARASLIPCPAVAPSPRMGQPPAWVPAHAALASGCGFLMARAAAPVVFTSKPLIALRRAGNCLNELDRLLTILLDEGARAVGMRGKEHTAFERSRDTPRKLRRFDGLCGLTFADTQRLTAIARIRRIACGDLCGIPRAMLARDLATATGAMAAEPDGPLQLSEQALADIAGFYLEIGERLARQLVYAQGAKRHFGGVNRAMRLDFSTDKPHLTLANVACDGI